MEKDYDSTIGGWTLLMVSITDSAKTTFQYGSSNWTDDTTTHNSGELPQKTDDHDWTEWATTSYSTELEAKYKSFNELPIDQIFLRLLLPKSECIPSDNYDCYGDVIFDIKGALTELSRPKTLFIATLKPRPLRWPRFFLMQPSLAHRAITKIHTMRHTPQAATYRLVQI